MVQNLCTIPLLTGKKGIILEKPNRLRRIFFEIRTVADAAPMCVSWISFDDPLFRSYFVIGGPMKYFKSEGPDIHQGDIWVYNASNGDLTYTATEILH